MTPGNYRELVTIQRPVASPERDSFGQWDPQADQWETYAQIWVGLEGKGPAKQSAEGVESVSTVFRVRCRYSASGVGINQTMRVVRSNGAVLKITSLARDEDGRRVELVFDAE